VYFMPKKGSEKKIMNPLFAHLWQENIAYDQLAQVSGLSLSRIARLCSGRHEASPEERLSLARALNVDVDVLFPQAAWSDLTQEQATQARLSAWISSGEGALFCRRLAEVIGG